MRGAVCKLPKPPGQQRGRQARRFSTEARRGTRRARTADRRSAGPCVSILQVRGRSQAAARATSKARLRCWPQTRLPFPPRPAAGSPAAARIAARRAGCNFWGIPVQWEGDQGEGETRSAAASASSIARVRLSRCMKNHASRSGGAARSEQTASPYRSERNKASRFSTAEPETVENPFCMQNASCRAFLSRWPGRKARCGECRWQILFVGR